MSLQDKIIEIANETGTGANTKERIASVLDDLRLLYENIPAPVSNATSGTYTPVITNPLNLANIDINRLAVWTKIGNIVTVKLDFVAQVVNIAAVGSLTITIPHIIGSSDLATQYIGMAVGSSPTGVGFCQGNQGYYTMDVSIKTTSSDPSRYVCHVSYITSEVAP